MMDPYARYDMIVVCSLEGSLLKVLSTSVSWAAVVESVTITFLLKQSQRCYVLANRQ